jgi:hypothetical protein
MKKTALQTYIKNPPIGDLSMFIGRIRSRELVDSEVRLFNGSRLKFVADASLYWYKDNIPYPHKFYTHDHTLTSIEYAIRAIPVNADECFLESE